MKKSYIKVFLAISFCSCSFLLDNEYFEWNFDQRVLKLVDRISGFNPDVCIQAVGFFSASSSEETGTCNARMILEFEVTSENIEVERVCVCLNKIPIKGKITILKRRRNTLLEVHLLLLQKPECDSNSKFHVQMRLSNEQCVMSNVFTLNTFTFFKIEDVIQKYK
jgi:hypothetical protein